VQARARFNLECLRVGQSHIDRMGLFATRRIEADDVIAEYVGEVLTNRESDERQVKYEAADIADYMFRLNADLVIDATMRGGRARSINHSCDPNCYAIIDDSVRGVWKIFVCAARAIEPGAELTYDYEFAEEDVKLPCFCGSAKCKGTLN
jgi:SET domain-containing protein